MIRGAPTRSHRQVETAAHATGIGHCGLFASPHQVEALEQLISAAMAFAPVEMVEVRHQHQVLFAAQQAVHSRELPSDTDGSAHQVGLTRDIEAVDERLAAIGAQQGRQDLDGRRLAGSVWTEQRKRGSLDDLEIDAVEDDLVTK